MAVSSKSWPKSKNKNAIFKKLRFLFIMELGESNKKTFCLPSRCYATLALHRTALRNSQKWPN